MSNNTYTHYIYLLVDENHKKYGGVRSCKYIPENDPYMGTSNPVDTAMSAGVIFTKHIVKTFDTRDEANVYESDWLARVKAAQSADWYNQMNTYPKWHALGQVPWNKDIPNPSLRKKMLHNNPMKDPKIVTKVLETKKKNGSNSNITRYKHLKVEYAKSPKVCPTCNTIMPYERRHRIFCNKSCSAVYTNTHRILKKSKS